MRFRLFTVSVLCLGLACADSAFSQGVEVTAGEVPVFVLPGETIDVSCDFVKDADEPESRLVFVMQMLKASDDTVLKTMTLDNNGDGYLGDIGTKTFTVTLPNTEQSVYFNFHAAPWSMNRWIVEKMESYPTDGTHPYGWTSGHYGTTQDLYYSGSLIARASTEGLTYCSGVAFEAFLLSYLEYNDLYSHPDINSMTWNDMETFRRLWYGTRADLDPELKLAALAIPTYDLGQEITDWSEVQKGDFVQLWRHSGSGHNPVFMDWLRNSSDSIIGLRYWGSQGSTNGIGYQTEYFGTSGFSIDPDRIYFGRVMKPRDQGDIDYALGAAGTMDSPTTIVQQIPAGDGFFVY